MNNNNNNGTGQQASRQAGRKLAQTTHTHTQRTHTLVYKMQLHALHTFGLAEQKAAIAVAGTEAGAGSKLLGNHKKLKGLLDLRFY